MYGTKVVQKMGRISYGGSFVVALVASLTFLNLALAEQKMPPSTARNILSIESEQLDNKLRVAMLVGAPSKTDKTDSCTVAADLIEEKTYNIRDNCVIRFSVPKTATINGTVYTATKIRVVMSEDSEVNTSYDAVLKDEDVPTGGAQANLSSSIVEDGDYIIAQVYLTDFQTPMTYRFKVRRAGPYHMKLSLGAALAFHKSDNNKDGKERWQLTPSPLLYTALGWSYKTNLYNYVFPRSFGLLINPDAVAFSGSDNILPLLTVGLGFTLVDDNLLLGVARDFGNMETRYILSWNVVVFP